MVNAGHEILKATSNFWAKNHAFTYLCVYTQTQRADLFWFLSVTMKIRHVCIIATT